MIIKRVVISADVKYKIKEKHGVNFEEAEIALLHDPLVYTTRDRLYLAIGFHLRYITVVFTFTKGYAEIITAYPSSDWQIRLYKSKKMR